MGDYCRWLSPTTDWQSPHSVAPSVWSGKLTLPLPLPLSCPATLLPSPHYDYSSSADLNVSRAHWLSVLSRNHYSQGEICWPCSFSPHWSAVAEGTRSRARPTAQWALALTRWLMLLLLFLLLMLVDVPTAEWQFPSPDKSQGHWPSRQGKGQWRWQTGRLLLLILGCSSGYGCGCCWTARDFSPSLFCCSLSLSLSFSFFFRHWDPLKSRVRPYVCSFV